MKYVNQNRKIHAVVSFWSDGGLKIKKNLGKCQESFPWKNVFSDVKKYIYIYI